MSVLVFVEARDGQIKSTSLEAVSEARRLADQGSLGEVCAVIPGSKVEGAAGLGAYGADRAWTVDDELVAHYQPESYVACVAEAVKKAGANLILFPASAMGRDLAPRVAARLGAGLASDCTALDWQGGALVATRPVYAGKAISTVKIAGSPALASLRPRAFAATERRPGASCAVEPLGITLDPARARVRTVEVGAGEGGRVDLTEAEVIVSGGRGLRGPEHFHLIEELAEALGGTVGASRAVVDAGWRPHAEQVGQTGKTVSPKLYVAVGISGAIQHLAGMSSARCIVAINKDPEAPIFKIADYGIVGDAFEVVPALTEALKGLKVGS
ncbi:MAG TPA: electron transfer flavoprotein subunit alpha/FixB family protein [Candidatus Eisenbacteria bacterium]|nr:electron transfer flavoprotein subunit alpha/FixB family protein [Candidatus Eisenbacteria bacterium]